uniref:Uncharacterized protein n=1 Tax=Arundo donax TaxID=35708 RepID=A0A0A8YZP3_ARUDO
MQYRKQYVEVTIACFSCEKIMLTELKRTTCL